MGLSGRFAAPAGTLSTTGAEVEPASDPEPEVEPVVTKTTTTKKSTTKKSTTTK